LFIFAVNSKKDTIWKVLVVYQIGLKEQ
jgi:hypothetical protein